MSFPARLLSLGLAGSLLASTVVAPAGAAVAIAAGDVTSQQEAERVDRVPTPELKWYACSGLAQCATVRLPLDYDEPDGASVEIALLRVKARKQASRIGSLFVNPGGPGGSGTDMAAMAPAFLSDSVLDRFDVVGFDPRGIGASDNLKCFSSTREQVAAQKQLNKFFPYGAAEEAAYTKAARAIGRACSTTGATLAGAMSTAEAARDLDVLRRAVGDPKLTYLGFSYGTALGQYYAGMFPDRVRALALDGVVNARSWTGVPANQGSLQDDRLRSADAAYRALRELLIRCDRAGAKRCGFAAGDPQRHFAAIARVLRANSLVLGRTEDGQPVRLTYADFIGITLMGLYSPEAGDLVTSVAAAVETLLAAPTGKTAKKRAVARAKLRAHLSRVRTPARDFPYDNSVEAFSGVMCTDADHPRDTALWPALTAAEDARAPYFGRAWGWGTVFCAGDTWTVRDEDAYRGPFNRRTGAPVLFVGNHWDPATSYRQATSAAKLLPGSRLLSSDNWGHTAYGTSTCVTTAVDRYLLRGTLPAAGTVCHSSMQPFTGRSAALHLAGAAAQVDAKQLPPVAGPFAGSSPLLLERRP
ncbi:peptidase S33 family protein [Actinoplanes sp. ATCC 53533]|uniref:alpha/beta hydrolase n=1 Tax=Actinoplanes sp. ATCC 53533 TaxID=1288362 RepID=UPI000F78B0F6|nr:alpha/beta hydrolase [Actinoplanes sp. ATCC 53533]RSM53692.1 peptidase S33 family protein [Actinoplanes sp. ATCC 53533]